MSAWLRWTTPHPGLRPDVELFCGDPRSQFDLLGLGQAALSRQSLAPKQLPPRLLEFEPARPYGYEDLLHARVVFQPLPDGRALVIRKIVADQVEVADDGGRFGNRLQ